MQDIVRDELFEYFEDFDGQRFNEYAILWHQLEPEYLVAVIAVTQEIESGKISCIELHRNSNYFNVTFGNGNIDETYMWEKADEETKQLLEVRGYRILQTEKFDHYIGYRCQRNRCNYAIYMYARGDNPATIIDGDSYLKEQVIELRYQNQVLKEENRTLKDKLEKEYEFMKQFVIGGMNLLEKFMDWIGEKVRDVGRGR